MQLYITPCIVTMPPSCSDMLVVPSNERLVGTQFSHFPVGGPTPAAIYIGERPLHPNTPPPPPRPLDWSLYQCEAVDGVVTELSGTNIKNIKARAPVLNHDAMYPIRCPAGQAVSIPSSGSLSGVFPAGLILTVAPFWPGQPSKTWQRVLSSAYRETLSAAQDTNTSGSLALPLLGAGARGAPVEHAAAVASSVVASNLLTHKRVIFCCQDDDIAETLDLALRRHLPWTH